MRWPVSTLKDVAEIIAGQSPPSCTYNTTGDGLPFYQGKADFGELYPKVRIWCTEPKKQAEQNDILLSVRAPIGPTNLCQERSCIGRGLSAIRTGTNLDYKYLLHYFRFIEPVLSGRGQGSTFSAITQDDVRNIKIPLPPLAEQKRIAAILDKADELRRKRRETIAKLDTLIQSIFLDMFGDPVTNPKGWDECRMSDLLTFLTSGSRGWAKYYAESGSLFLRIQNLINGELVLEDVAFVTPPDSAEARRTKVQPEDVLVSITADLGRTVVIPRGLGDAYINQHLAILRVKNINPFYLAAFLTSSGGQSQFGRLNHEGVKAGLNFDDLKALRILLPPKKEQERFVHIMNAAKAQNQKIRTQRKHIDSLANSIQQQIFACRTVHDENNYTD